MPSFGMLSQVAYREAVRLAPVSEFNRNWEIELGAPAGKTATIPNGVDVDLYHPHGTRAEGANGQLPSAESTRSRRLKC